MGLLDNLFSGGQTAQPNMPGLLQPQKGGIFGISGPTLMALGAGIASGDGIADGLGKGFGLASQIQNRERQRESELAPLRMSYQALVDDGVNPQDALLQVFNPGVAKARDEKKQRSEWQKMVLGGAASSVAGSAGSVNSSQPRGIRNNNPLNIEAGTFAEGMAGFTGSDGRFAQFESPQHGIAAADTLLTSYGAYGFNTVESIIGRWAPAADGNNVSSYSSHVAGRLGVDPGAELDMNDPAVRQKLIHSMAEFENGRDLQTEQARSGNIIEGLTNRQRTLIAAAGPEKGLPLLLQFHSENAAAAKDTASKTRALNATKSVLASQFPNMAPEQIEAIALSGNAGAFISRALKPTAPLTSVAKINEAERLGQITPEQAALERAKATAVSKGLSIRTNPDGTMEMVQGGVIGGTGQGLGKPTVNKIQEKQFNAAEMGARLSDIRSSFKPEYLTVGKKIGAAWKSGLARLDPSLLTQEDRSALSDFGAFKSGAINNINRILNELSGAAVSPQEATRLRSAMPDPGEGIFDGDDPVQFEAKLNRVIEETDKALIRYEFYVANGGLPGSIDQIPLTNIKKVDGQWQIKTPDGVFAVKE